MSLQTRTFYTVCCDICGTSADEGTDYAAWAEPEEAEAVAEELAWRREDDQWLCLDCLPIDEDGDA